jgi:hypothetical protein
LLSAPAASNKKTGIIMEKPTTKAKIFVEKKMIIIKKMPIINRIRRIYKGRRVRIDFLLPSARDRVTALFSQKKLRMAKSPPKRTSRLVMGSKRAKAVTPAIRVKTRVSIGIRRRILSSTESASSNKGCGLLISSPSKIGDRPQFIIKIGACPQLKIFVLVDPAQEADESGSRAQKEEKENHPGACFQPLVQHIPKKEADHDGGGQHKGEGADINKLLEIGPLGRRFLVHPGSVS